MTELDKAVMLYTRMADRLEKSGHAPRQARVYREQADVIRGCQTLAQATETLRNTPHYLAPGAALLQDKLAALGRAAQAVGMPDVAKVYWDKVAAIEADVSALYEVGYEVKARNLKQPYLETLEAFMAVYRAYVTLSGQSALDSDGRAAALGDLRSALGRLKKPSSAFETLAGLSTFRRLVEADDLAYEHFVQSVPRMAEQGLDVTHALEVIEKDLKETLSGLSGLTASIQAAGHATAGRQRRAQALAQAPSSRTGSYRFSQEEVQAFV